MKRLITVFALIAALVVLMGCGRKSGREEAKPSVQQTEISTLSLMAGDYAGKGEIFNEGVTDEKVALLQGARMKRDDLSKRLSDLKAEIDKLDEKDALKAEKSTELEKLAKESAEQDAYVGHLEGGMIALRLDALKFTIAQNEDKSYLISNLNIVTDKDESVKEEDGKVNHVHPYFGNETALIHLSLNDKVEFDGKTGAFSFSFVRSERLDNIWDVKTYSFKGNMKESQLSGAIEVILGEKMIQPGTFSVRLEPKKEEAKVEEAKVEVKAEVKVEQPVVEGEQPKTEGEQK